MDDETNKNLSSSILHQALQTNGQMNLPVQSFLGQNQSMEMQQNLVANIQDMLDQLSARGVNSMLVTVDHVGDISIHGSQKGQLFLKDNTDIAERFAKVCSDDVWTLLGAQKRFLEIGRQNQNKPGGCNDKVDYPIDFSHERPNYFPPPHSGSNDRSSTQENSFVQGIMSQSNQNKQYQPANFLHGNFTQFGHDNRPSAPPFFQGGFNQGIPGTESFPQTTFMPGLDVTTVNKDAYHNVPTTMIPQMPSQGTSMGDKTNGITQSEADLIKEMLTATPVQDVLNSAITKTEKDKTKTNKTDSDKSKSDSAKKKRERRPDTWQRNIKKKLKTEGKEYVNAKGKLVPAKKLLPVDCTKCKQRCTDKISEDTRKKIFDWFWKLGSYTAQKEFVISRVTQVATKTSKRRHVHRLFSFEINGKYESVCKPFFSRTLGIGDSYIYKAFEQKARDLFVHDGRGKHSPANKTSPEQVAYMHEHLEKYLSDFDMDKPLPKGIHAQKWYEEYMAACSELGQKPVSKHIYRKIFQEYVRKYPPGVDKKKSGSDRDSASQSPSRPSESSSSAAAPPPTQQGNVYLPS